MQGTLGGLVVLVLAVWGKYAFNRLWQRSLMEESTEAMSAAERLGLVLQPLGYGPSVRMCGTISGSAVWVQWTGGLFGSSTVVKHGDAKRRHAIVRSAAELEAVLFGEE